MKNVVIIGGGIIGNFVAYYLSNQDLDITIVDDQPSMPPASYGNCGLITPSHIMPMNQWGVILKGLRWLGKKQAPLRIKPQASLSFLSWFISFALHSNAHSRNNAAKKRYELLTKSKELYEDFFRKEKIQCNWKNQGILYACTSKEGFKSLRKEAQFLDKFKLSNEVLSKEELLKIEPSLSNQIIGGAAFKTDGWLNPSDLISGLRAINIRNGVSYLKGSVMGFSTSNSCIKKLQTSIGEIDAKHVVIANGAKSPLLVKKLGIHLPIIPGKGYNITYDKQVKNQPQSPIYMVEKKVVATPWESGFRLGSTMEFSGYDLKLDEIRLATLKQASQLYLRTELQNANPVPWAGWRPMTSNELPIIQASKNHKNLVLATGHGMLGLSMAPVTGQMVNELINE